MDYNYPGRNASRIAADIQRSAADWKAAEETIYGAAMVHRIRASLQARLEGRNEGGDIEIMRLVDEIVKKESRLCSLCGQGPSCRCA